MWGEVDIKATALLKLIYLEMYGHDMSWASFHILEVMSSVKYAQKRVGYLGAVQSLRSDTEVLMLATNLLKKVRERGHIRRSVFSGIIGLDFAAAADVVSAVGYSTAYHQPISCDSLGDRSPTAPNSFTRGCPEEDHRHPLSVRVSIS